ncbi:MAG: replicative DNA helicase [Clostridia bacterium]
MAEKMKPRMLPHNLEAEQAVIGCALLDDEAAINIVSKLTENDFYSESHKDIFNAIKYIYSKNAPIDILTLIDELEKKDLLDSVGGASYVSSLTNVVPSAVNYESYLGIVKRDSVLRRLISASEKIIDQSFENNSKDDALSYAEKAIFEISESGQTSELVRIDESLIEVIDKFETIHKDSNALKGLKTGFYGIDEITNGLQKSDLILIAARPGVGKTSLGMNIVTNAALNSGAKCAVFSLEMPKVQLAQRMLCSVADVKMTDALGGKLTTEDWKKLWKANTKLSGANIYVDDSSLNKPSAILSKCRKIKREKGLDLIMIDYLQLMSGDGKAESRQNEISEISRKLKILAKEINVPVIVLSQLSRAIEQRTSHRPVLSDLRESGAIEQDADMVIFIHKPDMYENNGAGAQEKTPEDYVTELIFAKHRNGQLGSVFLGWRGANTSFVNLNKDANFASMLDNTKYSEQAHNNDEIPPMPEVPLEEVFGSDISDIFDE